MRTVKLTISYDGTGYSGWQIQSNGLSVQELIQRAVRQMTGEEVSVIGASRTDAGVHALGQVAHFQTGSRIPALGFARGLNSLLPADIAVLDAEDAAASFHARRDAVGKSYLYRILSSPAAAPLARGRCWQLKAGLDAGAMREAAGFLVGEHDFESFRASGCGAAHAVRRIDRIEVSGKSPPDPLFDVGAGGSLLDLVFEGPGFLRHMIRNIAGTLAEVGLGRIRPDEVKAILEARKREQAGRCAPACGLYLVRVVY